MQDSGRVLFFESVPSADSISTPFWLHFLYLSSIYGVENKDWKSGILTVILESCDKFAQISVSRHSLSEASHETLKLSSLSQFIIIILLCSSLLEEPPPICRLFVLLSTLRSINVSSASPSSSLCPSLVHSKSSVMMTSLRLPSVPLMRSLWLPVSKPSLLRCPPWPSSSAPCPTRLPSLLCPPWTILVLLNVKNSGGRLLTR